MRVLLIVISVIFFSLIGGIILALALSGTNVVLPGLGLVITGAFLGFVIGAFLGAVFGLIIGYLVSRVLTK